MLIRSNAPVFGANRNPYQRPGEWNVSVTSRNLVSNDHYNGKVEQVQRQTVQSYVTNKQNLLDIGVSRVITKRMTLSVGVPFVNSSWASRDPISPFPGPRKEIEQNGRGIGDISVTSRFWVFDPDTHIDWNIATGIGVKAPTGNARAQDMFPGNNPLTAPNQLRYVDGSVQPGDGGWGAIFEAHIFRLVKRVVLFGSGSYLANPMNQTNTPSGSVARGQTPSAANWDRLVNSIPDQYMARLGGAIAVWRGLSVTAAWRVEGMKRYDLWGDSNGHRRPGTEMFFEPGVVFSTGRHTWTFNVPLGYYYNRHPDPNTGNEGDATFPRHIFLTGYSFRLGNVAPASDLPPAPAVPSVPGTSPEQQQSTSPDGQAPANTTPAATSSGDSVSPQVSPVSNAGIVETTAYRSGLMPSARLKTFSASAEALCVPVFATH